MNIQALLFVITLPFLFLLTIHVIIGNIEVSEKEYKYIDNLFIYKSKYEPIFSDKKVTYFEYYKILKEENQFKK